MDETIKPEEFLETVDTSTEYPSDADVQDAKDLTENVAEKHRKRRKRFEEVNQKKKDVETEQELKEAKKKLKKSRRSKVKEDGGDNSKTRDSRKKKKHRPDQDNLEDEVEGGQEVDKEADEEVKLETMTKKKVDRAAIAAALREKRRKEKEEGMPHDTMKDTVEEDTADLLSTRFDPDQPIEFQVKGLATSISEDNIEHTVPFKPPLSSNIAQSQIRSARFQKEIEPEITWENLKQQETITEKQTYDFFCKQWPPHPKTKKAEPSDQPEDGAKDQLASEEAGDASVGIQNENTEAYTGIKSSLMFVENLPPLMPEKAEVVEAQSSLDLYYYPGYVDDNFMGEKTLRNKEEEGLYVGRRPQINWTNERRLESRIQREKKLDWFGEDGRVKILPDPLKEIPFRPLMWNEQFNPIPDHLKTEYFKPLVNNKSALNMGDSPMVQTNSMGTGMDLFELNINLDHVEFSHHHLFSVEHVLAQRLRQLFNLYHYIMSQDQLAFFEQRVASLKHAISHLQERHRIQEVNNNMQAAQETIHLIGNYRQEIKNARQARNNEEAHTRRIIASIIKTWKQIKATRQSSGMTLTDVLVKIRKEPTNELEDREIFEQEVTQQLEEERLLHEDQLHQATREYNTLLENYNQQQAAKAEARARQAELVRRRDQATSGHEELDEQELMLSKQDVVVLSEPDLICPEPLPPFNENLQRQKISLEMENSRRLPGEPRILPILRTTAVSDQNLSREETNRRNLMQQYFYFGELLFNHKLVTSTASKPLNSDFVVRFGEVIPIVISQYPQLIMFKLYEKSGMSSKLIAQIQLDIPTQQEVMVSGNNGGAGVGGGINRLEMYNFNTRQVLVHKSSNAVGSGVNSFALESLDGSPSGELMTPFYSCGLMMARSAWQVDDNGLIKLPQAYLDSDVYRKQAQLKDPLLALGITEILEMQRRQQWHDIETHLDPNDARDIKLIKALHTNEQLGLDPNAIQTRSGDYFRLNPAMDEFDLTTDEDIDRSLRFRMILLRNMNVPDFRSLSIPPYDDKVPLELIREYDNRKSASKQTIAVTGFEARKLLHKEFIEKVREEVLMKFKNSLSKRPLAEMVREEEIPTISDILPKILNLKTFNRPLQRVSEPRKPISVHNIYEMNVDIIVVIRRASSLPVDTNRNYINPFVQVSFQNTERYTDVLEGPNPAWDMELRLPFKPPTSTQSLDSIKECLLLNVYDQQVLDMNANRSAAPVDKAITVHQRYERRCIGSLEIPFNTIYLNGKIEGNFRLNQPAFILGYESSSNEVSQLSVFITLDPEIHPPQSLKDRLLNKFSSIEEPRILTHADLWYDNLVKRHPNRYRRPTVVNLKCQETLINRYVAPLAPPEDLNTFPEEIQPKAFARYVSLIPFMNDALVFPGITDIWSTCDQFLRMLIGDEEEHAVLLCNYFLHLYAGTSTEVYLVLGKAIPEGDAAYVMTRAGAACFLWNASLGQQYEFSDPTCPMFSVGLLVNQNNVWANVQQNTRPCELKLELNNRSQWHPLFAGTEELQTVQPSAIIYQPAYLKEVEDYQLSLETQLRNSLMDWRMGLRTNFVLGLRRDVIKILTRLESSCSDSTEIAQDMELQQLISALNRGGEAGSYQRMFGFPLHLPYMDLTDVLERVKATGIHLTAGHEFCVAVYVRVYSNSVMSIWIFLANLFK